MRVLIVDDHQLIRAALKDLLSREYPDLECIDVSRGDMAFTEIAKKDFDTAIVDLFIPGETAFVFIRKLCEQYPALPVIVLSATENQQHMQKCIDLGAQAFVNKGDAMNVIVDAVKKVLAGGLFLPEALSNMAKRPVSSGPGHLPYLNLDAVINKLTDRQLDILRMIAEGKSNKVIALERKLSDNTVKVHVSAILRALDLSNRTQIGMLAQKLGLVNDDYDA